MSRLTLEQVHKNFGELTALAGASFSVNSGEIFGFVGANGAGKTTAMRIILGVLRADGGSVTWDEMPLDAARRRQIGYMPEERGLYPKMKVGEQLQYIAQLYGQPAATARQLAGQWAERLGFAHRLDDQLVDLSLGNQQRVQLAAALVHEPIMLVLDEPFSGLDPTAVAVMSQVLVEQAAAGIPVIFSSHQLDLVERLCHRVGIIAAGQMRAVDTVDRLRRYPQPRFEVVGAPSSTWLSHHPQAQLVEETPVADSTTLTRTVVQVPTADEPGTAALLQTALHAGPVLRFGQLTPSLTQVYGWLNPEDTAAHTLATHTDSAAAPAAGSPAVASAPSEGSRRGSGKSSGKKRDRR